MDLTCEAAPGLIEAFAVSVGVQEAAHHIAQETSRHTVATT
ncbi:MAG: hypothetical protein R2722_06860 [Tessaracoccus sp.]